MSKVRLTKNGFKNLQNEYKQLIEKRRPVAIERLKKARAMGDLSENSEYFAAKEELAFVEGRVLEIEEILKNAQIIESNGNKNQVDVGVKVVVEVNGKKEEFQIVGEFEANPSQKRLSFTSPIGKALLGKKVGETVKIQIPVGKTQYKIIAIK